LLPYTTLFRSELGPGQVECRILVACHGFCPNCRPLRHHCEFDSLARFGLAGVLLVSDMHLDTLSPGRELLDLGDLVLDVGAKAVGDGQLTAVDNNVHDVSLATRSSDSSDPMPLDG